MTEARAELKVQLCQVKMRTYESTDCFVERLEKFHTYRGYLHHSRCVNHDLLEMDLNGYAIYHNFV